jgi:hypothetical protein
VGDRIETLNRSARPITLHMGWVFVLGVVIFMAFASYFLLVAMDRWSRGEHVDWQGFSNILIAMGTAAAAIVPIVMSILRDRRIQKVEEIRAGRAPEPRPFDGAPLPAPSSETVQNDPTQSGGGLINNQAIS